MGKRVLCLVLSILFLACTNAFAGGSGNPIETIKNQTPLLDIGAVAFEYNYINQRMNDLNDSLVGPQNIEVVGFSQIYGKIIWGKEDSHNIYANVGAAAYKMEFNDEETSVELDLETGPYFGIGANILRPFKELDDLCDECTINWGADIQANLFFNDVDSITRGGTSTTADGYFYGIDGENSVYLTCKYDIEKIETSLIGYLGGYHSWIAIGGAEALKYNLSGVDYKENMGLTFDLLSFGMLLGLDVNIAKYVTLNVEGRFIGETALTTGATVKF